MGVNLCHNEDRKVWRKEAKSQDIYLRLLVQLYLFLACRTNSAFNKVVLKRLFTSQTNQTPIPSLNDQENEVCALHGTSNAQNTMSSPKSWGTGLLSGPRKGLVVSRHFGKAPGTPHSHSKPYVRSKGQKFKHARGRRASQGYRN
uniref:Large ribosomal subunit protein uL15/eL18 domain-containing protein n=1 Tax=Vombatus ursinus TaxID=29139 RepID=A0A4X2L366_VOMUR